MRLLLIKILVILAIIGGYGWIAYASESNSDAQGSSSETVIAPQESLSDDTASVSSKQDATQSAQETASESSQTEPTVTQEATAQPEVQPTSQPEPAEQQEPAAPVTENPAQEEVKPEVPTPSETVPTEQAPTAVPPAPSETEKKEPINLQLDDEDLTPEAEIKGIDTVEMDEPAGNWLFKRVWWEKSERLYEKIKSLADSIAEKRTQFFTKRTELDRTIFDPFYFNVGIGQGEILQTVSYFVNKVNELRSTQGDLNERERELLDNLTNEKNALEQLKNDVEGIMQLDHAIDDALMKMMEQINLCRTYERQAWDSFKTINRELSDKKARELYLAIQTYWRNINEINGYLTNTLASYFDGLLTKAKEQVERIKTALEALKEKGINIKEQAAILDACPTAAKPETDEDMEEIEPEPQRGIFDTILYYLMWPFKMIGNTLSGIYNWVISWFAPKTPAVELEAIEEDLNKVETEINETAAT